MQETAIRFIDKVTVTGADDTTHHHHLVELAEEFPFVEFGILFSRDALGSGKVRYPSHKWLNKLAETCAGKHLPLAGHMCGAWVREILMGQWPASELQLLGPGFEQLFSRWQINTHGMADPQWDPTRLGELLKDVEARGQQVIFQYNAVSKEMVRWAVQAGYQVAALCDLSGGTGKLPEKWERFDLPCPVGFAGGLSPLNVAENIVRIAAIAGHNPVSIDAETHLRSQYWNNDSDSQGYTVDYFDMAKVRAFLKAAQPWVIGAE